MTSDCSSFTIFGNRKNGFSLIDNLSYTDKANALLKPGKHSLTVRLTKFDYKDRYLDSLNRAFVMFIGLASTKHYDKVLNYNKMESYNPSCHTKAKTLYLIFLLIRKNR